MALSHSPRIVTDGLVLCLDAGNKKSYPGSGTTWTDLSGRGNNGTLTNGPTYSSSNGGSIVFDGVNDYINYGTSGYNDIRGLTTTTINFFCYCTGFGSQAGSFSWSPYISIDKYQNGNAWRKFAFYFANTSGDQSVVSTFFDGVSGKSVSKNMVVLNKLLNITSTVDSNYIRLYVNGILEAETSGMILNPNPQASEFTIGARIGSDYNGYFKGNIFQSSIYNRALTLQEIQQNFNALRGRFGL
jgi:hypothetical protein